MTTQLITLKGLPQQGETIIAKIVDAIGGVYNVSSSGRIMTSCPYSELTIDRHDGGRCDNCPVYDGQSQHRDCPYATFLGVKWGTAEIVAAVLDPIHRDRGAASDGCVDWGDGHGPRSFISLR